MLLGTFQKPSLTFIGAKRASANPKRAAGLSKQVSSLFTQFTTRSEGRKLSSSRLMAVNEVNRRISGDCFFVLCRML